MQFNVLQWQYRDIDTFYTHQYPHTDGTSPSLMHKLIQTGAYKGLHFSQFLSCQHHWNHQTLWLAGLTSALWRTVFQTEFLWCPLLEIGGTLYSSHVKATELSRSQHLYLVPHFFTHGFCEEGLEKQLYDSRSLLPIYIRYDLGYQRNMHLVLSSVENGCINSWWKIMRTLLRAWKLEHNLEHTLDQPQGVNLQWA